MSKPATVSDLEGEEVFTCGVDVGTINMCVTFVSNHGKIVIYHGAVTRRTGPKGHEAKMMVLRYPIVEGSMEECPLIAGTIQAYPNGTLVKHMDDYHGFLNLLGQMKELERTVSVVIESQVSMNGMLMPRLDGIIFGWMSAKRIHTEYIGAKGRGGFAAKAMENVDLSNMPLPKLKARGGKTKDEDVKIPSYQFVCHHHPEFYKTILGFEGGIIPKLDDICDSVLYAHIAK